MRAKKVGSLSYVIITVVNTGDSQNQLWQVYGHEREGLNERIDCKPTKADALELAHKFHRPVIIGYENSAVVLEALRRLQADKRQTTSRESKVV